jgi:hypothetical protein
VIVVIQAGKDSTPLYEQLYAEIGGKTMVVVVVLSDYRCFYRFSVSEENNSQNGR